MVGVGKNFHKFQVIYNLYDAFLQGVERNFQ